MVSTLASSYSPVGGLLLFRLECRKSCHQSFLHLRPVHCDNGEQHTITDSSTASNHVRTKHAFARCAELCDGSLGSSVPQISDELHAIEAECIERVRK